MSQCKVNVVAVFALVALLFTFFSALTNAFQEVT